MVERYCDGVVPAGVPTWVDDADAVDLAGYHTSMDGTRGYLLHDALAHLWRTVTRANEYVQSSAPWGLAKDPARREELDIVLASLMRQLARQAVCVAPFMPGKAQELWLQLGGPHAVTAQRFDKLGTLDVDGWRVRKAN